MMKFSELPTYTSTIILITAFLICITLTSLQYNIYRNKMKLLYKITSAVTILALLFYSTTMSIVIAYMNNGERVPYFYRTIYNLPVWFVVLSITAALHYTFFVHVRTLIHKSTNVTVADVSNGLNNIEVGVCIYQDNGVPRLVNTYIDDLSYCLLGHNIYDGDEFWNQLGTRTNGKLISKNVNTIIVYYDRRYYKFELNFQTVTGVDYKHIHASDVTEEFKLSERLKEENERRQDYQNRLKKYSAELEKITINEEILKTKMNIHNDYGQVLLIGKHSIKNEDARAEFLERFGKISNLNYEESGSDIDELYDMAKSLDLNVIIDRKIDEKYYKVVVKMLYEVFTNTIKHTNAHNVILKTEKENQIRRYICYNDDKGIEGEFKEGGGLSSFRHLAEKNGAVVKYNLKPYFQIILEFKE